MRKGLAFISLEKSNIDGVVLAQKLYNPLRSSDDFLSVILIQRGEYDFVVWNHNAQTNGFFNGAYSPSEITSWKSFNNRGRV